MIRKLRTDWVAKMQAGGAAAASAAAPASAPGPAMSGPAMTGPAMTGPSAGAGGDQALWHDFHDKFLSYGGPPIPLVRKQMLGGEGQVL
jgi:hypothetical protein